VSQRVSFFPYRDSATANQDYDKFYWMAEKGLSSDPNKDYEYARAAGGADIGHLPDSGPALLSSFPYGSSCRRFLVEAPLWVQLNVRGIIKTQNFHMPAAFASMG
jgi:hypothetical protein